MLNDVNKQLSKHGKFSLLIMEYFLQTNYIDLGIESSFSFSIPNRLQTSSLVASDFFSTYVDTL